MNLFQSLREALQSLAANKLRSALTILGIVIGVAAVISLMAVGRGATSSITSSISGMGTNLLTITSGSFTRRVMNGNPLTSDDMAALQDPSAAPDVAAVAATVSSRFTVTAGAKTTTVEVSGVTPEYAQISNYTVAQGSYITQQQYKSRAAVAVLGPTTVTNLFGNSADAVGKSIRINGQTYQIIGVFASKGGSTLGNQDDLIQIPLSTAKTRLIRRNPANRVDSIVVSATSADTVTAAEDEISAILRIRHNVKEGSEDFTLMAQSSLVSAATSVTDTLTMFLGGIAGISLLVGGIGIMNIMLVSVTERTREIGLRKALGARRIDILFQFITESILLSVFGGLIGVGAAYVICLIIAKVAAASGTSISPSVGVDSILLATLFSAAVGLMFGLYPSNRAAGLQPVEALRYE